jgi:hypothetical protein
MMESDFIFLGVFILIAEDTLHDDVDHHMMDIEFYDV